MAVENQDPQVPSTEDILDSALGGMDVKSFLAGDDLTPAPEPESIMQEADPAQRDQQIEALRQEIEHLKDVGRQQHQNWNAAHMAQLQAEANVRAIEQARMREAQIAQQAAAMQPPQVQVDWSDLYDQPEQLGQAIQTMVQQYAEWARNAALGQVYPYVQQYQSQQEQIQPLMAAGIETLLDKAKDLVHDTLGNSAATDFDAYRDKIKEGMRQPGGLATLSSPRAILHAFNVMALEDGRSRNWQGRQESQPIHAGGAPSASGRGGGDHTPPELLPIWKELQQHLFSEEGYAPPTAKDLRDAGIDWKL